MLHTFVFSLGASGSFSASCCTFRKKPDPRYPMETRWFPQVNDSSCSECRQLHLLQRIPADSSYPEDFYKPPSKTDTKACADPLGMENGDIPTDNLFVSDAGPPDYDKWKARLNYPAAWCARPVDTNQWIRVDLGKSTTVTGLITQGRSYSDVWTKTYKVKYSSDNAAWAYVTDKTGNPKVFPGNTDDDSQVTVYFPAPLHTRFIQIEPQSWTRYICIRFELLGCKGKIVNSF
ncbi:retinoschisin-like [Patiria miniata]|uniref:F5/8 type C domain-containing protein n=1 Tax=Patiria miniata TaxID=46514 RepID=A0A914BAI6_PATMI|nr:retinoschisin-like [Patiria miniata]